MKIEFPTSIVAEIPEPIRSEVQAIRNHLRTPTAKLPVEITLAGSSGVGAIPPGVELQVVIEELDRALMGVRSLKTSFAGIRAFPGGSTVFLSPTDRAAFDFVHGILRDSGIPFSESPYPYTPHCTIRSGLPLSEEDISEIYKMRYPEYEFQIDTVSIYSLDASTMECTLLYQRRLEAEPGEVVNSE